MSDQSSLKGEFERNGYVVLEHVFTESEVRRMRREADRILELIVNSSVANGRKSGRLDLVQGAGGGHSVRKIQPVNDLSLFLAQVSADERFLGPMAGLMGDTPMLMEEKLNYKQPLSRPIPGLTSTRADDRFPVHADWAYFRAQEYPREIVSSAICMDDCTPDNGPIRVWPGSHTEYLEHESSDIGLQVKPGLIDPDAGVDLLAPAGSVLLFHSVLVHSSQANTSGRPRRLMIYSHYPASFEMCPDVRNGPKRLEESPFEWEYVRKVADGETSPSFSLGT